MPITRETIIDRRQPHMQWSAIFGGAALAVGLWIMLQVLGLGLGMTAVDAENAGSLRGAGIGAGIWSLIAPLIAMFVGAMLTGRLSGTRDRGVAAMHGSVVWALALALGLWMIMAIVGSVVGGVARVSGAAASATSSLVTGAARAGGSIDASDAMGALGIDTNDLVAPINQRLQREGKPPITAKQLNATVRAVAQRGLHQGTIDRQVLVEELARNTALSRGDAEEIADQFGARYQELATQASGKIEEVGENAKHVALQAADKTGKALALGGLMMLLSLGAALGGAALGVRRPPRDDIDRPPTRTDLDRPLTRTDETTLRTPVVAPPSTVRDPTIE
jgi:hypothetical protein